MTRRTGLMGAARLALTGAVGAGLVYGAASTSATWRAGGDPPVSEVARAALENAELLCPGAELAGTTGVRDISAPTVVSAASAPAALLGALPASSLPGAITITPGDRGTAAAAAGGATSTGTRGESISLRVGGPDPVLVTGAAALAPAVVAAQETRVAAGAAADPQAGVAGGLSTAGCAAPRAEAWLAAGGNAPGRQERLILLNPGANPLEAVVEVHGARGRLAAAGTQISVEPRSRTTVLLDALAPGEVSPMVRVSTRGGFMAAWLGDQIVDGITARGLELTGPLATPARDQVIPGVSGRAVTTVRIVNPGSEQAVVSLRSLTSQGPRALPGGTGVVRVAAGASIDVPLGERAGTDAAQGESGLPAGIHALQLTSDLPVTAAAQTRAVRDPRDLAWAPAAPRITGIVGTAFPKAPPAWTRTLSLAATGGPAQVAIATIGGGEVTQLSVPADGAATLDLSAATGVFVRVTGGTGRVRAAVATTSAPGRDQVASVVGLTPARVGAAAIPVRPFAVAD